MKARTISWAKAPRPLLSLEGRIDPRALAIVIDAHQARLRLAVHAHRRQQPADLELAERGHDPLGSAEQIEWLDRFSREEDNFRAVLRRALRRGDAATALRMGRAMAAYWMMRGGYSEGRDWMKQIGALPSAGPRERVMAWTIGAIQAFLQGDFGLIETGLDDALRLAGGARIRLPSSVGSSRDRPN